METMDALTFARTWRAEAHEFNREMATASAAALASVNIPESARYFLITAGLPAAAAPFLSFEELAASPLPTVAQVWNLPYHEAAQHSYCIGSDGAGDPISLSANGQVWLFNHDNNFEPTFVNASVAQLATCLLVYQRMVADIVRATGSSLSRPVPADIAEHFRQQLQQIDPDAYAGVQDEQGQLLPSLWQQELQALSGVA